MRHFVLAVALLAAPAAAEVKSGTPGGFEIVNVAVAPVPPDQAYRMLGQAARWWNKAHTYSGDATNLSLELRVGGCFCEVIPSGGGAVEHGRVVLAQPGKTLRLSAALGPLQAEGVSAALTWTMKPVPGGTEITQTYVVGGYVRGGADKLAPIVDQVIGEQLRGLVQALTPGK
jgi:uncharacterized protein YndB with AHSA1/START domain